MFHLIFTAMHCCHVPLPTTSLSPSICPPPPSLSVSLPCTLLAHVSLSCNQWHRRRLTRAVILTAARNDSRALTICSTPAPTRRRWYTRGQARRGDGVLRGPKETAQEGGMTGAVTVLHLSNDLPGLYLFFCQRGRRDDKWRRVKAAVA